jgi:hypothetical protein
VVACWKGFGDGGLGVAALLLVTDPNTRPPDRVVSLSGIGGGGDDDGEDNDIPFDGVGLVVGDRRTGMDSLVSPIVKNCPNRDLKLPPKDCSLAFKGIWLSWVPVW